MTTIRIIDLETENNEYLGQKASPHCPDNYIVMPGWRDDIDGVPGVVQDRYFKNKEEANASDWFQLDGVDMLVCHNAGYEISWFLSRHRAEFEKFLQRGGRVVCTQLAEYLLSDQTWTYPALDEVAPKHGGTHKVDGIKLLWEQGVKTSEIDPELLREYLSGPEGDVNNTAIAFYSQRNQLIQRGMWRMFLERCEGLLAFSYCEFNGLYINQEVAARNHAEQLAELAAINEQVEKLLPPLPETLEFNWGSDFHLSALLFGGSVKYQQRVPRINAAGETLYEKVDCYKVCDEFIPVDDPTMMHAVQMSDTVGFDRYKSGKNKGQIKIHKVESTTPQTKWDDALFKFDGLTKLETLPKILRDKFLGRRPEYAGKRFLPCGTPVFSTSGEVLTALGIHGFEQAALLSRRASLEKDNGTYYISHDYAKDGSVKKTKGMLQYVGPDSIIHHNLNCTATVTARLSHNNPNLGNLPRDGTSKVKQMFTSRFGDDGVIIEVDYSALEVVMLAALSGDQGLLDQLQAGTDMHCLRLSAKLGEPYESVLAKCNDHDHPDHKRYKQMRTDIKAPSFAAQYGASASGIAFATGVSVEYAQEFLDTEARLFPRAIEFRQVIRDAVQANGMEEGNIHRELLEGDRWATYRRGHWQAPGGTCYSFRQFYHYKDGQNVLDYKDTQIANYGIQGEAGYLMTLSSGRVIRWLLSKNFFGGKALLINNVHDALYLDCHVDVVREVGLAVAFIMEDAPRYMSAELGYSIAHVPFPAVAEAGPSMYEKEKIV
jgi:hypothetical protein